MKLRNKKTGEIKEFVLFDGNNELQGGATLKDLMEEWEDYQEPKHDYYFLRDGGNIDCHWYQKLGEITERRKEIGNYFETKEEAERTVEKLKAWKRLKDKGFKISGYEIEHYVKQPRGVIDIELDCYDECIDDLDLLFGGEDE